MRIKEKTKIQSSKKLIIKANWNKQVGKAMKGLSFKNSREALRNL